MSKKEEYDSLSEAMIGEAQRHNSDTQGDPVQIADLALRVADALIAALSNQ